MVLKRGMGRIVALLRCYRIGNRDHRKIWTGVGVLISVLVLSGCGGFGREQPTRTPVPTFTATPVTEGSVPVAVTMDQPTATATVQIMMPTATETFTPLPPPPTATPTPSNTPTPIPTATDTPVPSPTPTETPIPTPTPAPVFTFDLVAAEKHPTESLAPNVVRVFLYVYEPGGFGLGGYSLRVTHNGAVLPVDQVSDAGLPRTTRGEPSPYTRFTNMNVLFVEPQAGTWTVQLVDANGIPRGAAAEFVLTDDEVTRELYVRYRQR